MATEIERKFLVCSDTWRNEAKEGKSLRQAYLATGANATLRVRITNNETAHVNIKGARAGATRAEFEYPVPVEDAVDMLRLRDGSVIEKTRYHVSRDGLVWDIDVFKGDNAGLVVAEVELTAEDQKFDPPEWAGADVTSEKRYYNHSLSEHPYKDW